MISRIAAITFIFICTAIAWLILGVTVSSRTDESYTMLRTEVGQLWGSKLSQKAPSISYITYQPIAAAPDTALQQTAVAHPVQVDASDIDVRLMLNHRQKGLLWYSTYRVAFRGTYRIANADAESRRFTFAFAFPGSNAVYDKFHMTIGSREVQIPAITSGEIEESFEIPAQSSEDITISFVSNGMDSWWYTFGQDVSQIRNFSLVIHTNFDDIDFPEQSISPTSKQRTADGWDMHWQYSSLLSDIRIGIAMPKKLNPGPWVSMVTYFAPVSLFLFFFMLLIFTTMKKISLHPMHYFFISAAFFSFHLLLAYLVDHISVHLAFIIASIASIALVVSYMRPIVGARFALVEIGGAQFIYLILFSYTFFFRGYTGLTIAISCVATLFIVMQATARLNWEELFSRDKAQWSPGFRNPVHRSEKRQDDTTATGKGEQQPG